MQITYHTDDYTIEHANKATLAAALELHCEHDPAKFTKVDLVAFAKRVRDDLKAAKAKADADAEAARLAQLEQEKADPTVTAILQYLATGFAWRNDAVVAELVEARDKIAGCEPHNVAYEIGRYTEHALYYDAALRYTAPLTAFLAGEVAERTQTLDEIAINLRRERDRLHDDCLNEDYYRHNSTDAVSNLNNIQQHKAKQTTARLLIDACRKLDEVRIGERNPQTLEDISDRRVY